MIVEEAGGGLRVAKRKLTSPGGSRKRIMCKGAHWRTGRAGKMTTVLDNLLVRAIALLDEETAALRGGHEIDLLRIANAKGMITFELERLDRTLTARRLGEKTRQRVRALRAKLEENRALLDIHIAAAREIAALLTELGRASESDGTYTVPARSRRMLP